MMNELNTFKPKAAIKVLAFQMQETGTYNPMFQRPMVANADGVAIDDLIQRIDSSASKRINPGMLAGVSYGMIAPSSQPGAPIQMLNGWDSRRIRFILHVLVEYFGSQLSAEEFYFQGFTDHAGVSLNGAIDPNMILVINNFVKVGQYTHYDPVVGAQVRRKIDESAQIINGEIIYNSLGTNGFSLRPNEICIGMQSMHVQNSQMDNIPVIDTRFQFNNKSLKTNKLNVSPASYLSTITDAYCMANIFPAAQFENNDMYERAKTLISTDNVNENPFFRAMRSIRGSGNGTVFQMSDLEYMDPDISRVTNCLTIGHANKVSFHSLGESEYWDGATQETQYATILGNAVPALMMELMISRMTFVASNHIAHGQALVTLIDGVSITGTDITQFFEIFKTRFIREIMNDITYNNQIRYNITMMVDIFGDTTIDIQLHGEVIRYVIPTFCDSIVTPMAVSNYQQFQDMTYSVEQILVNVHDAVGQDYATINRSYGNI